MKYVAGFLRFWYDFIVGDDWTVAVSVVAALGIAALLVHRHAPAWLWLPAAGLALAASAWRGALNRRTPP